MTRSVTPRTGPGALRHAGAEAPAASGLDYAIFSELSPESKLLKGGWNTRVFTNTDSRKGDAIRCDFATGIVTVAPGVYHISGTSVVAYDSGGEPAEMTTIRAPASAGYCRLRSSVKPHHRSRHARRRERRPQRRMCGEPEFRQPHPERVRSLFRNRQAGADGSRASGGKQPRTNLPARVRPGFEVARDGQDRHPEDLGRTVGRCFLGRVVKLLAGSPDLHSAVSPLRHEAGRGREYLRWPDATFAMVLSAILRTESEERRKIQTNKRVRDRQRHPILLNRRFYLIPNSSQTK